MNRIHSTLHLTRAAVDGLLVAGAVLVAAGGFLVHEISWLVAAI